MQSYNRNTTGNNDVDHELRKLELFSRDTLYNLDTLDTRVTTLEATPVTDTGIKGGITAPITAGSPGAANRLEAVRIVIPRDCTIKTITMWPGTTGAANYKTGIYSDNPTGGAASCGYPLTLLGTGEVISLTGAEDQMQVTTSLTSELDLVAGVYWLAFISDVNQPVYYAIGSSINGYYYDTGMTYAAGLPATFPVGVNQAASWTMWVN